MNVKNFFLKTYNIFLKITGIFQREFACFLLKKSYFISPFIPKYLTRLFTVVNVDKTLLKNIEHTVCLSKVCVSMHKIISPINSLTVISLAPLLTIT